MDLQRSCQRKAYEGPCDYLKCLKCYSPSGRAVYTKAEDLTVWKAKWADMKWERDQAVEALKAMLAKFDVAHDPHTNCCEATTLAKQVIAKAERG